MKREFISDLKDGYIEWGTIVRDAQGIEHSLIWIEQSDRVSPFYEPATGRTYEDWTELRSDVQKHGPLRARDLVPPEGEPCADAPNAPEAASGACCGCCGSCGCCSACRA